MQTGRQLTVEAPQDLSRPAWCAGHGRGGRRTGAKRRAPSAAERWSFFEGAAGDGCGSAPRGSAGTLGAKGAL